MKTWTDLDKDRLEMLYKKKEIKDLVTEHSIYIMLGITAINILLTIINLI